MNKIITLGQKYCKMSCSKRIRGCRVAQEIGNDWCPLCEGVVFERDTEGIPERWSGGYIPVIIEHAMPLYYACDCEVGRLRQKQGCKKYKFPDNDICFSERIHQQLLAKWERCKLEDRPSYSNIREIITRILANIKAREESPTDEDGETPWD